MLEAQKIIVDVDNDENVVKPTHPRGSGSGVQESREEYDEVSDEETDLSWRQKSKAQVKKYKKRLREDAKWPWIGRDVLPKATNLGRFLRALQFWGVHLLFRWERDRFFRAYSAIISVSHGIKIHQTTELVDMKCLVKGCPHVMRFTRQLSSGLWKLIWITCHLSSCFSRDMDSSKGTISDLYTQKSVASLYFAHVQAKPNISSRSITNKVQAVGMYARQPHPRHYRVFQKELRRHIEQNREVGMASLAGYCKLLEIYGHKAKIVVIGAEDMVATREKAGKHNFNHPMKGSFITSTG